MSEMVPTGSKYTDDIRTAAAIQYAIEGSLAKIERGPLGIPSGTVCGWKKEAWWVDLVEAVRSEKADEHIARYTHLVDLGIDRAIEDMPNVKGRDALIMAATATDKALLLAGKPTSISGKSGDIQALAKQFKELSEQWNEKQVDVVSTQHKDKSST